MELFNDTSLPRLIVETTFQQALYRHVHTSRADSVSACGLTHTSHAPLYVANSLQINVCFILPYDSKENYFFFSLTLGSENSITKIYFALGSNIFLACGALVTIAHPSPSVGEIFYIMK